MGWVKSTKCESHECVEVAFRTASACESNACVEVAVADPVLVRDSKLKDASPILAFSTQA